METDNKVEMHRDKRIKLDNNKDHINNNGNDKNNNEIDISNLSKQTVKELKVIASSLAITIKNSARKNEIIEKIKLVLKRKQKSLEKQEYSDNLNSFNKEIIEFKIKDGIDPSEWLFWKIFRNKFIFRRIMSFMDTQFTPEYDSINLVSKMIESNQLGILRDKVIRNQYLSFKLDNLNKFSNYFLDYEEEEYNNETIMFKNDIYKIFKCIKSDNDQDRMFYHHLFKNYSKYIFKFNAIMFNHELVLDGRNDREGLVNDIIKERCLPALQILIQDYQYELTELNLQYSINSGATIFIQFILQQKPIFKEIINTKLSNNLTTSSIKSIKSLNWLQNENLVDFKYKDGLRQENIILQYINSKQNQINESTPLKLLIFICQLLLKLTISTNYEGTCNNSINIEEIESFSNKLTKQELKLPLSDVSNQIEGKKQIILKLLNLYYSISKIQTKPFFYRLYFNEEKKMGNVYDNQGNIIVESEGDIIIQIKHSLRYGNFELLEKSIKKFRYLGYNDKGKIKYIHDQCSTIIYNYSKGELFSCCTGEINKEKRLGFTNSLIKNLLESNEQERNLNLLHGQLFGPFNPKDCTYDPLYNSNHLLNLLVEFDDAELVNLLLVKALDNNFEIAIYLLCNPSSFIKSSEILKLLFEGYRSVLELGILQFRSIQLVQAFESLVSKSGTKFIEVPDLRNLYFKKSIPNSSINILKYIIEKGSSKYILESISSVYDSINKHFSSKDKFKMMKLLFLNYQLNKQAIQINGELEFQNDDNPYDDDELVDDHLKFHFHYNSLEFIKFLDWLFINHNDYLKNNDIDNSKLDEFQDGIRFDEYQDGIRFEIYFLTGRLNQLNENIPLYKFIDIDISNIDQLNFICNKIKNTNAKNYTSTLSDVHFHLLRSLISSGKLKMLEHIQQYNPWLLKSKNGNSELSSLDPKQLKCLLYQPLQNNNLIMAEFLFEFLSLTKKEINDYSSIISKVYFKNN